MVLVSEDVNFYERSVNILSDIKIYKHLVDCVLPKGFEYKKVDLYYNNSGKFSTEYICNDSILITFVDFRRVSSVSMKNDSISREKLYKYLQKTLGKKCLDQLAKFYKNELASGNKFNLLSEIDESNWLYYLLLNLYNNSNFSDLETSTIGKLSIESIESFLELEKFDKYTDGNLNLNINANIFNILENDDKKKIVTNICNKLTSEITLTYYMSLLKHLSELIIKEKSNKSDSLINRETYINVVNKFKTFSEFNSYDEEFSKIITNIFIVSDYDDTLIIKGSLNMTSPNTNLIKEAVIFYTRLGFRHLPDLIDNFCDLSIFKFEKVYMNSMDYKFLKGLSQLVYVEKEISEEDQEYFNNFINTNIFISNNVKYIGIDDARKLPYFYNDPNRNIFMFKSDLKDC